jgi:peptidoglycan/xylan/chitin deacetylase (PgdA/CDA1 family)
VRRQVGTLRRWGYELLTCGEWARRVGEGTGAGCATLTFDDGFADNLHTLVPVLEDLGAPATVFVVSGWLGGLHPDAQGARIVDAAEVRALHAAGVEIGAHTVSHPDLTELPQQAALEELRVSKAALEDVLGVAVPTLAYPFGRATPQTIEAAREAGFTAAVRALGQGRWDDPLDLPRQDVGNRASWLGLRLKRDERYIPLMAHRPARMVRRARLTALGAPLRRRGGQ